MKRIYELPEMKFDWDFEADIITASGNDDIASDQWSGGVVPQIII